MKDEKRILRKRRSTVSEATVGNKDDKTLADDLLRGAGEIAGFVLGDPAERRKIYSMDMETLGFFYMGKLICARRSTIRDRIAAIEAGEKMRKAKARAKTQQSAAGDAFE